MVTLVSGFIRFDIQTDYATHSVHRYGVACLCLTRVNIAFKK